MNVFLFKLFDMDILFLMLFIMMVLICVVVDNELVIFGLFLYMFLLEYGELILLLLVNNLFVFWYILEWFFFFNRIFK